jgi:TraR antiactivator
MPGRDQTAGEQIRYGRVGKTGWLGRAVFDWLGRSLRSAMRRLRGADMQDAEDADQDAERMKRISAYSALEKAELEAQAIVAVKQLRLLVATAQILYEQWVEAEEDPTSPATVIRAMQADYLERQRGLADKQNDVSEMLEALGYVPDIRD